MKIINNVTERLGDDLKQTIKPMSKVQICASIFSMYGFEALKQELSKIESLQFIFTNSIFYNNKEQNKETKEFKIDSNIREKLINGTEFEVRLKNELTGKAIAKECAEWIKKKVIFKTNINDKKQINKFINVETNKNKFLSKKTLTTYIGVEEFNTVGLG